MRTQRQWRLQESFVFMNTETGISADKFMSVVRVKLLSRDTTQLSSEIGTTAPCSNREITKAWAICICSVLSVAGAMARPELFVAVIATLIAAIAMLGKSKQKVVRLPLILSIWIVSVVLSLGLVVTVALYLA